MKKFIATLLIMCLFMTLLCGCKSEAVTNCENLITDIGTVTSESLSSINLAEDAYSNLPEDEKSKVSNYSTLIEARDSYNVIVFEELVEKLENADYVKQVDIDSANKVYDSLSEAAKQKTTKKDTLDKLDSTLTKLEKYALTAADAVKGTMKDESSFKINEIYIKEGDFATPYAVLIKYNAENSFGATIDGLDCVDITKEGKLGLWGLGLLTVGQERATANIYGDYLGFDSEEIKLDAERIMKHLQ